MAKALEIDEKFTGPDDPIVIPDLTNLAAVYEKQQQNAKASEARQRVAHVQSQAVSSLSGSEEKKQWTQFVKQSFTQFNAAEFSNETPIAQRTMRYSEAKLGPQDYRVAAFLVILATQYYQGQAAFKKAEPLMARAMRIQQKTRLKTRTETALAPRSGTASVRSCPGCIFHPVVFSPL